MLLLLLYYPRLLLLLSYYYYHYNTIIIISSVSIKKLYITFNLNYSILLFNLNYYITKLFNLNYYIILSENFQFVKRVSVRILFSWSAKQEVSNQVRFVEMKLQKLIKRRNSSRTNALYDDVTPRYRQLFHNPAEHIPLSADFIIAYLIQ